MSQNQLPSTSDHTSVPSRPLPEDGGPPRSGKTATATGAKLSPSPPDPKDTWREVVETVVFVVVLVLMLKSFTAEAFVIPTGSMAETLWGYQKLVTCPKCTFEFPVNCSSEVEGKHLTKVTRCTCPNCRYEINFEDDKINPSCNTGDRVLVAKHLNDLNVMPLERLDVVVFKFPEEPQRDFVPMNYIKRLIGLPGETIGIKNGDIYIGKNIPYEHFKVEERASADRHIKVRIELPQGDFGEPIILPVDENALITRDQEGIHVPLEELKPGERGVIARERVGNEWVITGLQVYDELPLRRQMHRNYPIAEKLLRTNDPAFQILRKPPSKVLALRRIVYDNNHQAKDLLEKRVPPRWAPEKDGPGIDTQQYQLKRDRAPKDAWIPDGKFGFQHKGNQGEETDWLRYRHLIVSRGSNAPAEPQLIQDFMGYNTNTGYGNEEEHWVGDLILESKAEIKEAQGKMIIELSKRDDRFQAQWDLSTGSCRLIRLHGNEPEQELAKKETSLKRPGSYKLRFANVDERLIVWVDGSLPFGDGVPYDSLTTSGEYGIEDKGKPNDREPASIGVTGASVKVSDLTLWRDTYYTNADRNQRTYTLYVQPGHYLCMGDNSPQSSDSRSWGRQDSRDTRGGLVPERLMLGRALLVYWPFWPTDNRVGPIK
jgi:signal peptidase I